MSSLVMHFPSPNKPAAPNHSPKARRFPASAAGKRRWSLQCSSERASTRRSANYKPPFWDFNYIQSLTTQYTEESHSTRVAELIVQVRTLLQEMEELFVPPLELIDDLQRLGIPSHFHHEINQILTLAHRKIHHSEESRDLYSTALAFRLLRQHCFPVSQDVFDCFKNDEGDFINGDTRGVLQLYEASFLLTQGEETLELAKEFSTNFLHRKLEQGEIDDENVLASVRYALELPIHWRIQRPNARCSIHAYGKRKTPQMNPIVLHLAKLDFNIIQAMHQQELKLISRWWKQTRLAEKLPFARDRLVECYLWSLGIYPPHSQHGYSRMMATKANILITIIDDIFDVYATLEELHLFYTAVQRWDLEALDQLPEYMQLCFLTLNNFINEMAYDVLKEQGLLIFQHLRKSWTDLCTSFIQEAQWHATGHTPTLNEYLSNGWISSSVPVILSHAFFLITNPVQNEAIRRFYQYHHDVIRSPSMLLRLANDLATSPNEIERGDVADSIQCYMKETGASREEAREHVEFMIWESWKNMNQQRVGNSKFSKIFIETAVDLGRMAQYMYQYGDGHGIQNLQIKERISSLLFQPIV